MKNKKKIKETKLDSLVMEKINKDSLKNVNGGINGLYRPIYGVLDPDYDTGCNDAPDCYTGANQEDTEPAM